MKDHVIGMGMEEEEITTMSDSDTNALFLQLVSGDIRAAGYDHLDDIDWKEYAEGENSGSMFLGTDGEIYYYLGD